MRISDWSSDVCSSDLRRLARRLCLRVGNQGRAFEKGNEMTDRIAEFRALHVPGDPLILVNIWDAGSAKAVAAAGDRKSVVSGKSVSVRVDLGGRRIIKKKTTQDQHREQTTYVL